MVKTFYRVNLRTGPGPVLSLFDPKDHRTGPLKQARTVATLVPSRRSESNLTHSHLKFNPHSLTSSNHESGYNEKWNLVEESPEKDKHTDYHEIEETTTATIVTTATPAATKSMSATMVLGRNTM